MVLVQYDPADLVTATKISCTRKPTKKARVEGMNSRTLLDQMTDRLKDGILKQKFRKNKKGLHSRHRSKYHYKNSRKAFEECGVIAELANTLLNLLIENSGDVTS